jgi:D-alanyl-D-alanine carboxypeptidase (penicillin-binding protein 5/6)
MIEPARRFTRAAQTIAVAVCLIAPSTAALAQIPYGEPKNTAIVMDAQSGEVLFAERADSLRYPASITKVMTLYLAFEALAQGRLHLGDQIVVSPLAAAQPATKLG